MAEEKTFDAVVVGSGPNGLAAAIALAAEGCSVAVFEARDTVGGGTRTAEITLPGFRHDICSAVHPMAKSSPYLETLGLEEHGLRWIEPPVPLAHPLDGTSPVILARSVADTAAGLGTDRQLYERFFTRFCSDWPALRTQLLGPFRLPRHPIKLARFGLDALRSAESFAERFHADRARALFAGNAAHSMLALNEITSAAIGIVLAGIGHAVGWPVPRGGSQAIADALAKKLSAIGGSIHTNRRIESLADLPPSHVILFDLSPTQIERICGSSLSARYRRALRRFRYGAGAFKLDYALNGPVPWRDADCLRAGTLHLGGTLEEIAASERGLRRGRVADQPFVLFSQPSLFDPERAPAGKHVAWAYCHVPNGCTVDMTSRIEAQIERFAPGFRDCVAARSAMSPQALEAYNPNYVGGDINGGRQDIAQLFTRPTVAICPYATSSRQIYICSASTPPGGGVHGMCGFHAAQAALRELK